MIKENKALSKLKRYSVNGIDYTYCRMTGVRIKAVFGTPEFDVELAKVRSKRRFTRKPKTVLPEKVFSAYAVKMVARAKRRASVKACDFDITPEWVMDRIKQQNSRCALTGIAFSFTNEHETHHNPYSPSLDRIDARGGYTATNTRVVCSAINTMLSDWGTSVFEHVCQQYHAHKAP